MFLFSWVSAEISGRSLDGSDLEDSPRVAPVKMDAEESAATQRERWIAEARGARSRTVARSSQSNYHSSNVRFLTWCCVHKPELLEPDFFSRLKFDESQRPSRRSMKAAMSLAPLCPPIKFQQLSAEVFILWIMSMKKSDGEFHVISTYMNHRSALFNLSRDYHEVMSTELNGEIGDHFIGLRRMIMDKVSSGDGSIKVGKDPLTFGLYQYVCRHMLTSPSREYVFARAFMVISWNLMSRAANTVSICVNHLEWKEDALCVYFAHMKKMGPSYRLLLRLYVVR